ncbi:uncharacterized protein LOC115924201 [Strongylocentrotus purpuratus]|uniref:Uncharacterized protein n=1 Tax=Strongylocentrotus purpuratus TaxID=7668 RepID=A0A7M7SZ58_STRPU|nr:uncharacterized protein LOC115924201 [Strongylocentrotus purpuratus]
MWIAAIGAKSNSWLQMDVRIFSNDLSTVFPCSRSNRNVSRTVVCDGLYQCDRYEDELVCDNSAPFLQEGESHFISLPTTTTTRFYDATLLQTNATNGFQVVFQSLNLYYADKIEIGTGNDPSDIQSVITTFYGYRTTAPDDVYVNTNEMWFATIGAIKSSRLQMVVEIFSNDLSTVFPCSRSNRNVSRAVVCDGLYQCDRYEDELVCDNSAPFLQEGESHFISLPTTTTTRFYDGTLLQTNATNGFQVVFQSLNLYYADDKIEIGTGNDPSDIQSVITTFYGHRTTAPDDVYVNTNEMWFAAIGAIQSARLQMDVEIFSNDLSTVFACSKSNINVSRAVVCDGLYQCDRYEDEVPCGKSKEKGYWVLRS